MRGPIPAGGTNRSFSVSVSSSSLRTGAVRRAARTCLERDGVDDETIEDVLLVLTELCTNAIAASQSTSMIDVAIDQIDDDALLLSVRNTGPGFDPERIGAPDVAKGGGRGIAIARALGDVDVTQSGIRTTVRVRVPRSGV